MLGQEGAFPNTPPKAGSITLSELDCKSCFQRSWGPSIVLVCFRSLHLRAGMEILDAAAQPQRPSPWSSLHTALKLLWSLEVTSLQKVRSLSTMHLSAHWPWFLRSQSLCGWNGVILSPVHFVIIPVTVNCGVFSRVVAQVASWLGTTLAFTELLRATRVIVKCNFTCGTPDTGDHS